MISSPSDVAAERDAVEAAIHSWNGMHGEKAGVLFVPWRWEVDAIPSLASDAQSVIDAQGVDRSDLIIALFWGRLGSPSREAVSGTVAEIERGRAQGKPVHVYFSHRDLPHDVDADQLARLREFKEEIQKIGLLGRFDSLDDLDEKVERALTAAADAATAAKRADYFETGVTDRVYEEVAIHWSYRPGADTRYWDATTRQSRRLIARGRQGLNVFTISLERDGDMAPSFSAERPTRFTLNDTSSRSSPGSIRLRSPRKQAGTAFAQDIEFLPALTEGDSAVLHYAGSIDNYKYAAREDVVEASANTHLGLRDWDFNGFGINHPIGSFVYSVFLPDVLGADPLGAQVDRRGVVDSELTSRVMSESFSQERSEEDGLPGWLITLTIREPSLKYTYRLKWRPAPRSA